ncbi:MAG: hypothetical protein ACYCUY_01630 [Acidithiobacillus sp.]|nr:hypothetical protein [Acidithiobacillus sp. S30A2]
MAAKVRVAEDLAADHILSRQDADGWPHPLDSLKEDGISGHCLLH